MSPIREYRVTQVACPRSSDPTDNDPHYPHRWGDPEDPNDRRVCPGRTAVDRG